MSADNGIYVLKTRIPAEAAFDLKADRIIKDFEYRVIHAQAIENISYNLETGECQPDFIPEEAYRYFSESPVFFDESEAFHYAHTEAKDCAILEYGVCLLDYGHQVFETFSEEELAAYDRRSEEAIATYRKRRDEEQQIKREAATIDFGEGMVFEPSAIYGYLIQKGGTKVHGSLSGIQALIVKVEVGNEDRGFDVGIGGDGVDFQFLPSDWNRE